jgi:hypothetical protein
MSINCADSGFEAKYLKFNHEFSLIGKTYCGQNPRKTIRAWLCGVAGAVTFKGGEKI